MTQFRTISNAVHSGDYQRNAETLTNETLMTLD